MAARCEASCPCRRYSRASMWAGFHRVAARIRAASPRAILLGAFALFAIYAFPGYMSSDSVLQLTEARSGHFTDGNPPLMAAEWWVLDRIVSGPILMLLLQGALLLGGLYVLMRRLLEPRAAAWTSAGIFLFPPVLVVMAVIWKDSQMAAFLVAGIAAMIQPRLRTRLVGLGLLVAACSLRHNALAAVVPLVAILFEWRPGLTWMKRLSIVAATAVVIVGAAFGLGRVLAAKHVRLTPVFNDIVGVIAYTDHRTDDDLRYVLRGVPLKISSGYQPQAEILCELHDGWRVMTGDEAFFTPPATDADWDALDRAWKELVLGDPMAYLSFHRADFARLLGWGDHLWGPIWNRFLEAPDQMNWVDHDASYSWAQVEIGTRWFYWLVDHTALFHPHAYALLALILLALCRDRLPVAIFASGLLYELSFFPVDVEPEFRYSHWMVASTCIALAILFVQRYRARRT